MSSSSLLFVVGAASEARESDFSTFLSANKQALQLTLYGNFPTQALRRTQECRTASISRGAGRVLPTVRLGTCGHGALDWQSHLQVTWPLEKHVPSVADACPGSKIHYRAKRPTGYTTAATPLRVGQADLHVEQSVFHGAQCLTAIFRDCDAPRLAKSEIIRFYPEGSPRSSEADPDDLRSTVPVHMFNLDDIT